MPRGGREGGADRGWSCSVVCYGRGPRTRAHALSGSKHARAPRRRPLTAPLATTPLPCAPQGLLSILRRLKKTPGEVRRSRCSRRLQRPPAYLKWPFGHMSSLWVAPSSSYLGRCTRRDLCAASAASVRSRARFGRGFVARKRSLTAGAVGDLRLFFLRVFLSPNQPAQQSQPCEAS